MLNRGKNIADHAVHGWYTKNGLQNPLCVLIHIMP